MNVSLAGPLTPPPGPVAPTPGPEPRTPINLTNTPGDADSLFRIAQPGSYYLTANVLGVTAKKGIEIASDNVTIDLMGFELRGVVGSTNAISADAPRTNVAVRNGTVSNWGSSGVDLAFSDCRNSIIEHIRASSNSQVGIRCGTQGIIRACNAHANGSFGIIGFDGSLVEDCAASNSGSSNGISCGSGTVVRGCSARNNAGAGINTNANARVIDCTSTSNALAGFSLGAASTISGCTSIQNTTDGIEVGSGCFVFNNTCRSNGFGVGVGTGISATGADNRIEGNNCTTADTGIEVSAAGNVIIRNTCTGNTTNWVIAANNVVGPILDRTAPASAAISGNSAPSSLGSTDANSNYSY